MTEQKFEVIRQDWLESERGWGTRPDGYSLHRNDADRIAFIQEHNDGLPEEVPDEYSRPEGLPRVVKVTKEKYAEILKSKTGTRHYR